MTTLARQYAEVVIANEPLRGNADPNWLMNAPWRAICGGLQPTDKTYAAAEEADAWLARVRREARDAGSNFETYALARLAGDPPG